ncbi:M14 family zinc carboxypeptidase [Nocardioides sp. REDSEA-S30_B4]|jgi:hypothetical protein|uniref:M14 family zinc carboxypeptidase n=1 Tax=Nocardioides sp. REDSEA-S30_B4 TaxID=1811552 RepID=UPI000A600A3F|nr:M14 family zinc carboxypeptidase [Nocardioides sp. REDSEA-S30_B4]
MNRRTRARRTALAATATLAALALAPLTAIGSEAATTSPANVFRPQLVKVDTPTRADKMVLSKLGLDLTEHAGHDYVEVVLHSATDRALLLAAGLTYDVEIPDLVARSLEVWKSDEAYADSVQRSPLPSGRDGYRTLEDYNADMADLAERFPQHVKMFELNHPTLDGRTVQAVEIGQGVKGPDTGKPTFVLMGLHHAREWPSGENAMEFAIDLAEGYGKNKRTTKLLKKGRVIVVPVVNADGFDLSRTDGEFVDLRALDGGGTVSILGTPGHAYMRKNCRLIDGVDTPDGTCALQVTTNGGFLLGVDLNRNYGGFWGGPGAAGSTPNLTEVEAGPLDPTYRGAAPFSEPETQNIQELVRSRQVTMLISNHTFGNLILRPNGVAPSTIGPDGLPVGDSPDEKGLKKVGAKMAAQNGYSNQHGWQLYDTTGTTEDWSYNATGGYGYTFEIGPDEFHPPFEDVVDQYLGAGEYAGKGNREAYFIALKHAVDTKYHGVLKGKAPKGATIRLRKDFDSPTWDSSFEDFVDSSITVGKKGTFSWIVNPSTRPVVMGKKVDELADAPFASETIEGSVTIPGIGTATHEYVAKKASDVLRVDLTWPTPDDLDLAVYLKKGDELVEMGTSGNLPGSGEAVEIPDAPAGTYVIEVINYASVTPSYTVEVGQFSAKSSKVKGIKERYVLTCEVDGKVESKKNLYIDRGQVKKFDLRRACR